MGYKMTEEIKESIVADSLIARMSDHAIDRARYIIKLIRALDSYRERDNKGRFIKSEENNNGLPT